MINDPVAAKLAEARLNLKQLSDISEALPFYAAMNAFLTASRSVLYVAQYQLGWKERKKTQQYKPLEEEGRKKFDEWHKKCPITKAILDHPLTLDRNHVIHHSGQAGFIHIPRPIGGGIAADHGSPFSQALWVTRRGLGGLPLEDDNCFYYLDDAGAKIDAVTYVTAYFAIIEKFVESLGKYPWR